MSKFVKLDETLLASDAWSFLRPVARVLYIELKRKFTGSNNGQIFLSHRDAALALGVHRNTVGPHFKALVEVGLIKETKSAKSGPSGIGTSQMWQLTEFPMIEPKPKIEKRKFDKKAPPKFFPQSAQDDGETVLDDEVIF